MLRSDDKYRSFDIVYVSQTVVRCNGKDDLAHPMVYLHIKNDSGIKCPYCGIEYRFKIECGAPLVQ